MGANSGVADPQPETNPDHKDGSHEASSAGGIVLRRQVAYSSVSPIRQPQKPGWGPLSAKIVTPQSQYYKAEGDFEWS